MWHAMLQDNDISGKALIPAISRVSTQLDFPKISRIFNQKGGCWELPDLKLETLETPGPKSATFLVNEIVPV